ncbi:MAG: hypothetical protein LBB19_03205 [Puniceicoccales bacterium]|nr:hypothetical protein [Puniceicoccales bacterium]
MFSLWSLGTLHLQALVPLPVQRFAIECLRLENPDDQVKNIERVYLPIRGKHLAIFEVTTANEYTYVIKVIKLENYSKDNVDDFHGSQLVHRRLQAMQIQPPPHVQLILTHYCQVVNEERIYSIEDELPPNAKGNLMLWMPKASGEPIGDFCVEKYPQSVELWTQSIVHADMFLYQIGICLGHALNPGRVIFNPQTGVLTIVNTAGVHLRQEGNFSYKSMLGAYVFPNRLMPYPDLLNNAINLYEDPNLKAYARQVVKMVIADRFYFTLKSVNHHLILDQIPALIDQYRAMDLIPSEIHVLISNFFAPTLREDEFTRILLANFPTERKMALRKMHEQRVPKTDAQCGKASPEICEAFQYYASKVFVFIDGKMVCGILSNDYPSEGSIGIWTFLGNYQSVFSQIVY